MTDLYRFQLTIKRFTLVLLMFFCVQSQAQDNKVLIDGHGPFKNVQHPDFATPKGVKAVFDVYTSDEDQQAINRGINTVARYLNMHHAAGLPKDNIQAALVIHGPAGKDVLTDAAYQSRFGSKNPNNDLLQKLHQQGVEIILCGQTAGFRGFERQEILAPVKLSLSAMTALISLQADGYQLINFN